MVVLYVPTSGTGLYSVTDVRNISTYVISTGVLVPTKVDMLFLMCLFRTVYVLIKIDEFQLCSHFFDAYMCVYA